MRFILISILACSGVFAYGADKIEVKASEEELKQMAQFEKDHADKAKNNAVKTTELAEKKKKKSEVKNEK